MGKKRTGGKTNKLLHFNQKKKGRAVSKEDFTVPRLEDVTSKADDTSIVQTTTNIEESKKAVDFIRKAFSNKNIVISHETERLGYVADFAHFDFMVHPDNLTNEDMLRIQHAKSDLDVLMIFWAKLWPYISKILKNYEIVEEGFEYIQQENIDVERKFAQQALILRIYKQFMENNNDIKVKFKRFYKEQKEEYDRLAEEAVKKYHEQNKADKKRAEDSQSPEK